MSRIHIAAEGLKDWKPERLRYLVDVLGISADVGHLRYQLLHRTASAIMEAQRLGAKYAAMVVQCFKNPELSKRQAEQLEIPELSAPY